MKKFLKKELLEKIKNFALKNKNVLTISIIGILLASITIYISFAYFQDVDTTPIIGGKVGNIADIDIRMYLQNKNDSGEKIEGSYSKVDSIPAKGYILNTDKSYCTNNSVISTVGKKVKIEADQPDLCYIYYDVKEPDLKVVTTYNGTIGVPPVVGATATLTCTGSTATYNQKYNQIEVTAMNSARSNCTLTYTPRTSKEYLNQKIIDLTGTEQGTGQIVNENANIPDYSNVTALNQNQYLSVSAYSTASYYAESGTEVSNVFTYSGTEWSTNPSTMTSNTYYNFKFNVPEDGYYQICYTISSGSSSNYLYLYKNTTSIASSVNASSSSSKNGCQNIDYITTTDSIRIVQRAYTSIATVNFSIKKVNSVDIKDAGYRYEGKNPNNYVWFNNELWRIIGVFDENSHGQTGQKLVKIIREDSLGGLAWNESGTNNWEKSNLKALLNGAYYNQQDGTDSRYCDISSCDYRNKGIDSSYRSMIKNVTWYLGGWNSLQVTAKEMYGHERGTTVYTGQPTSGEGYIGVMYPSDYGYSVLASSCARTTNLGSYRSPKCAGQSWLYKDGYEWTITPYSSSSYRVFNLYSYNMMENRDNVSNGYPSRPVLYLDASVYVMDGVGSRLNPYIIGMG